MKIFKPWQFYLTVIVVCDLLSKSVHQFCTSGSLLRVSANDELTGV